MAELKYYTFDQNNSGGSFVIDEAAGVGEIVVIQAYSEATAIARLHAIGDRVDGFWDFCECCGERWSTWSCGAVPMWYDKPLEAKGNRRAFVHDLDETFREVNAR